jgi:hypothetical protein
MDDLEVLSPMSRLKAFEMSPECMEVDRLPRSIVPSMALLDIVSVMITVDVKTDTLIILTCNR